MNQITLADEILIVHAIKKMIDHDQSEIANGVKYTKIKTIRELIRRIQHVELLQGTTIKEIPKNLRELMIYLKNEPIARYLPLLSQDLDPDYQEEVALDRYNQLTPTLQDFITEEDSHEQIQKHIVALRQKIIDSGDEHLYEICRFFFSAENNFDTRANLTKRMIRLGIPMSLQNDILQNFYLSTPRLNGKQHFCPYCGEKLTNEHFDRSKVCHHFKQTSIQFKPLTKQFKIEDEIYRLDPQVVKSIVLPNIGEKELRDRLLKMPEVVEVVMYPFFDSYDLKVTTQTRTFWLDVKDYQFPPHLAKYFANNHEQTRKLLRPYQEGVHADDVFLLIPKHRLELSSNQYLNRLRVNLNNHRLNRIKVHGEDDFIELLKQETITA